MPENLPIKKRDLGSYRYLMIYEDVKIFSNQGPYEDK